VAALPPTVYQTLLTMPRRLLPLLVLALAALPAASALAASDKPRLGPSPRAFTAAERDEASEALDKAVAISRGRGVEDGHELTPALREVAVRLRALRGADRRQALALLARPTRGEANPGEDEYDTNEETPFQTEHFRIHWVRTTEDAPGLSDSDADGFPDYVELVGTEFERVYSVEHGQLGWRMPPSDGVRGGNGLTDVYIAQLGDQRIFGYSAPDPGQDTNIQAAFLVVDNDYTDEAFARRYPGDSVSPLRVTAAHEYNHVIQFGIDVLQDAWMFESTAVWMEDFVYDEVNDYVNYLGPWAVLSEIPITQFSASDPNDPGNTKAYGSAVWNRWLEEHFSPDVIRLAWEASLATRPASFAPGAYDRAIRQVSGGQEGFFETFTRFVTDTAEWRTAGFSEGEGWPDMQRLPKDTLPGSLPFVMRADGPGIQGQLNHTAFVVVDVEPHAGPMKLIMSLPRGSSRRRGPDGSAALVGRAGPERGGSVDVQLQRVRGGGRAVVPIGDSAGFERLTAVLANADIAIRGFSPVFSDWVWVNDAQRVTAHVSTDFTAPRTRRRSPRPNARNVSRSANVVVIFREPMLDVDSSSFRLVGPGGRRVRARVSYNGRRRRATLNPRGRLRAGARYRVEFTTEATDNGANPLPRSQRRWSFITRG
jgi:hypothetical protein